VRAITKLYVADIHADVDSLLQSCRMR
jgi:hypothetical protein